ncbi:nuclear transport factor 2 family protein [Caballeronia glebae]|jgi:ketosteroid isomerase-like protein|uniref:nuclear transport factor 2 family protein n=1 Tax=Caballeronia glebae TaxID=1777143 RepID=UPI0038B93B4F
MPDAIDVIKEAYAAFGRGDVPGVLNLIQDVVDWRVVGPSTLPYATTCRTREDVQRFFADLLNAEEITRFEPREFIDAGDRIVVIGFVAAVVKATGRTFETEWVHIFTVEDGRVSRWLEFFDTAAHG